MPDLHKNLLHQIKIYGLSSTLGMFAITCHAGNDTVLTSKEPETQYFEELIAQLPENMAPTKAVAQTLIQFERYKAYQLAEREHCQKGWVLTGKLVHKTGPGKLTTSTASTHPVWMFASRRQLMPWTCKVEPSVYLASLRSHLPQWISIRYLTASQINTQQTIAGL